MEAVIYQLVCSGYDVHIIGKRIIVSKYGQSLIEVYSLKQLKAYAKALYNA